MTPQVANREQTDEPDSKLTDSQRCHASTRKAQKRARYLDRTTVLDRREALAVAYSERGYSSHGIAREIDATPGTVAKYLDRAVARYGPQAVLQHAPDAGDLEPVDAETVLELGAEFRQWWRDAAREHPDAVPPNVGGDLLTATQRREIGQHTRGSSM